MQHSFASICQFDSPRHIEDDPRARAQVRFLGQVDPIKKCIWFVALRSTGSDEPLVI